MAHLVVNPSRKSILSSCRLIFWMIIQEIMSSFFVTAFSECNYFARIPVSKPQIPNRRLLHNNLIWSARRWGCKDNDSDDDAATQACTPPRNHISTTDLHYMKRAVSLARIGYGNTFPNPAVGCLIVQNNGNDSYSHDVILGSGFHPKAGWPHAEIFALLEACDHIVDGALAARSVIRELHDNASNLSLKNDVANLLDVYKSEDGASKLFNNCFANCNATAYVTLEPCCHTGQTPPCALSLVAAGITRVVVGYRDPNPRVDGGGIQLLKNSGIDVQVLSQHGNNISNEERKVAKECYALVKYFVKRISPQTENVRSLEDSINGKRRRALRSVAGRLKSEGTMREVSWPKDKMHVLGNNMEESDYAHLAPIDNRFIEMVDQSLWDHELVLVRLNNAVRKKKEATILSSRIGKILNAHVTQVIGHTALLYRPGNPAVLDLNGIVDSMPD